MRIQNLRWVPFSNQPDRHEKRIMSMLQNSDEPIPLVYPRHDPPLSPRDEAAFLLQIGAEVEHVLMVEYLYAAYSLTGAKIDGVEDAQVVEWQKALLDVAREEMGHFITVLNLQRAIGAPLHFERESYPLLGEFYPFDFELEGLTKNSLAKYIVTESPSQKPANIPQEAWDEIFKRAKADNNGTDVNRVGVLYSAIHSLLKTLPEEDFEEESIAYQADFREWGRGYQHDTSKKRSAEVIVDPVTSKTTALDAVLAISEQGEGVTGESSTVEESHFQRFYDIYSGFPEDAKMVTRNIAKNPTTSEQPSEGQTKITNETSLGWAQLHNSRYRLLLTFLSHALHIKGLIGSHENLTPRGKLVASTFGEMYNIRALSNFIMDMPISSDPNDDLRCGPPFEQPYTVAIPDSEGNRWRLHRDVLQNSRKIIDSLLPGASGKQKEYLEAMVSYDSTLLSYIDGIIAHQTSPTT